LIAIFLKSEWCSRYGGPTEYQFHASLIAIGLGTPAIGATNLGPIKHALLHPPWAEAVPLRHRYTRLHNIRVLWIGSHHL
jgi:hypothetical protein